MKRVYPMKPERTKKDRLRADILLIAALLALALGFFAVQRLSRRDGALASTSVTMQIDKSGKQITSVAVDNVGGRQNILSPRIRPQRCMRRTAATTFSSYPAALPT